MKITAVRGHPVHHNLIIKVETDEGLYGIGEAGLSGQVPAALEIIRDFAGYLEGKDARPVEHLWQDLFRGTRRKEGILLSTVIAGIDMALWDLQGKRLDVPVWQLLGGRTRERIRLYCHVAGATPETVAAAAGAAAGQGYEMVRLSLTTPQNESPWDPLQAIAHTAEACRQVRQVLGDSGQFVVDLHTRLTPPLALRFCRAVASLEPFFIEDPIRAENPAAYAQLRRQTPLPLAAGELLYSPWQFRPFVEDELVDYLRVDLCAVGGFTPARKVAAMAEGHYQQLAPHSALGPLLLQASLHLCAAMANVAVQELTSYPEWWHEVLPGLTVTEGGWAPLPGGPGLGVAFNEKEARRHPPVPRRLPRWRRPDGSVQDW